MIIVTPPVPTAVNPTAPGTPKTFKLETGWLAPVPIWHRSNVQSRARTIMQAGHQKFESDLGGVRCSIGGGSANANPLYYQRQYVVNTGLAASSFGLMYQMNLVDHAQVSYTC